MQKAIDLMLRLDFLVLTIGITIVSILNVGRYVVHEIKRKS
jgi:hypothetical protein